MRIRWTFQATVIFRILCKVEKCAFGEKVSFHFEDKVSLQKKKPTWRLFGMYLAFKVNDHELRFSTRESAKWEWSSCTAK